MEECNGSGSISERVPWKHNSQWKCAVEMNESEVADTCGLL